MRPFRFGVNLRPSGTARDWAEKGRRLEALGYSTAMVPDHIASIFQPFPALVALADATTTLRIGTFVLNNDFRHPALVARDAATIDLLSGGRLELGLGAGHMKEEYDQIGLPFDPPGRRVERLAESVYVIKRLLAGEEVTFAGEHYRLTGHTVFPVPAVRPSILVGGNGKKLLALAGREADIVGLAGFTHRKGGTAFDFSTFSADGIAPRVELVREAAAGRDAELNALLQTVEVTDDRRAAAEAWVGDSGMTSEQALDSPFALFGSPESMVEDLQRHRELLGISYFVVFEPYAEAFAPVVERLHGS